MTSFRAALATIGVAVAVAGLAMIADPSLAGAVPSGDQVVAVIGLLAGIQGARVLWHRYRSDLQAGSVEDDPESVPVGPSPGTDFDELATAAGNVGSGRTLRSRRDRLRRRLERAIVASLRRRRDLDREAALDAVEAGTWTDDPVAAALFTDDGVGDDSPGLLPGSSSGTLTRRANRAAVAVADLVGVETGDLESATGGGAPDRRGADASDRRGADAAGEPPARDEGRTPGRDPGGSTDGADGSTEGWR